MQSEAQPYSEQIVFVHNILTNFSSKMCVQGPAHCHFFLGLGYNVNG